MLYDDTAGLRGADSQVDEQSGGTWLAFRRPSPNAAIADIEVLRASKFDFGPLVCIAEASSCGLGSEFRITAVHCRYIEAWSR
jgi:hypothetical protein